MELNQIMDYWKKKYPNIFINVCETENKNKYFCVMRSPDKSADISVNTIGELIRHGEEFLRMVS